jgi:hypothetical protein
MTVKTSADGDSYIANTDAHGVLVFNGLGRNGVWTPCTRQKFFDSDTGTYGSIYLYPVSTIVASGLVANNNCSKRTATAKLQQSLVNSLFCSSRNLVGKVYRGYEGVGYSFASSAHHGL